MQHIFKDITPVLYKLLPYICIIVLGLIGIRSLATPGLFESHDSEAHLTRLVEYDEALKDGQIPPRWGGGFFQGLGSPVLSLSYQLPYFFADLLHFAGLSFFDSFKVTFALSFILSTLFMYLALKPLLGNWPALTGAILYSWAPYRFLDIYVRGAFGEAFAFIFPPLILLAVHKRSWFWGTLAFAGLFLSHPVASFWYGGAFIVYALLLTITNRNLHYFLVTIGMFVCAFGLASFNLVPALQLSKYTHYSPQDSKPFEQFPTVQQLIDSPWGFGLSKKGPDDEMSFMIGKPHFILPVLALVLIALSLVLKKPSPYSRWLVAALCFAFFISVYLMLEVSIPLWQKIGLPNYLDFPWRILMFTIFTTALLGAWITSIFKGFWQLSVVIVIVGLTLFFNWHNVGIKKIDPRSEADYIKVHGSGDALGEYASVYRKTNGSAAYSGRTEILAGDGTINVNDNRSQLISGTISMTSPGIIRFNIMYFPGWTIMLDSTDIIPSIQGPLCFITEDDHIDPRDTSGLIACKLSEGFHTFRATYTLTPSHKIGNMITLTTAGLLICLKLLLSYQPITKPGILNRFLKNSSRSLRPTIRLTK